MCAYTMLTMGSGGGVPFLAVAKYSISWGSAHTHAYTCMHACTHARTKARMFAEVTHPDICNASTCPCGAGLARHWQGVQPAQARPRGSASRRLVSCGPAVACPHRTTACGAERGQARNLGSEISRESLSWPLSPPLTVQDAVVEDEGRRGRRRLFPKRRVRVAQEDGCHHRQDT